MRYQFNKMVRLVLSWYNLLQSILFRYLSHNSHSHVPFILWPERIGVRAQQMFLQIWGPTGPLNNAICTNHHCRFCKRQVGFKIVKSSWAVKLARITCIQRLTVLPVCFEASTIYESRLLLNLHMDAWQTLNISDAVVICFSLCSSISATFVLYGGKHWS